LADDQEPNPVVCRKSIAPLDGNPNPLHAASR
jgi:hypothetical protein